MYSKFLVFTLMLSAALSTQAGKLYKIVDDEGNITYGQFPPSEVDKSKGIKIEAKEMLPEGITKVETKGTTDYCGNIALPNKRTKKEYFFTEVANKKRYWTQQLEREQKSLIQSQKYYSSKYSKAHDYINRKAKLGERMRDLNCALAWTESLQEASAVAKQEMNTEITRLDSNLKKVKSKMNKTCGEKPLYEPGIQGNKEKMRQWKRCSRQYSQDIRKLENLISTESRKLGRF